MRPTKPLIHAIDVQHDQGTTRDAAGAIAADWQTWAAGVPCYATELGGDELQRATQLAPAARWLVELAYLPGLAADHRLQLQRGGDVRTLGIEHAENVDGLDRLHRVLCRELKPDPVQ